jgi:UDP-N-acetylmuramate dehydrogenase
MLNEADKKWLAEHFGQQVLFDEPMSGHTTFAIGGPADALVTVETDQQIKDVVGWARNNGHSCMILGAGSNLLVRDGGIRDLVLRLAKGFDSIEQDSEGTSNGSVKVTAGAGALMSRLGKYALDNGLAGLSFSVGIPGTVGGALRMNAGAWGTCMADAIRTVTVLRQDGHIETLHREKLRFSYRRLNLEEGSVILRGQFDLKPGDRKALREEALQMQRRRRRSQPLSLPSAGCMFKNPPGGMSAGELIDRAGLKGLQTGGAAVSTKHANFIVNRGHAGASDVLALIRHIQETLLNRFGVNLEPEVTIVGEEENSQEPL